jgi:hypothetical protein
LEIGRAAAAVQHAQAVERGLRRDLRDFLDLLLNLLIERLAIRGAVRTVGRFDRQCADALQVVDDRGERTAGGLRFGHGVVGVVDGLVGAIDLRGEILADCKTRCVVRRAVDAQARRQAGQGLRQQCL